jgi:hypothetical protein
MLQTKDQFFKDYITDIGEKEFKNLYNSIDLEYYEIVETEVKKGIAISKEVYNSLSDGQKYHFNKHYNFNLDMVLNLEATIYEK